MKRTTFSLIVALLLCVIITLVGYNELTLRQETKRLQELNQELEKKEPAKPVTSKVSINCFGDNLTLGNKTTSFPSALSSKLNIPVNKFGGNYDQTMDLSVRLGSTKVYVKNITIPSSPTPVNIQLYGSKGEILDVLKNTGSNFSTVEINGISGKLKYNKETKKHTFTRDQNGKEVKITKATQVKAQFPQYNNNDIAIIFTGTYDPQFENSIFRTTNYQSTILSHLKTKKYIVVSLTSKRRFPHIDDMNEALYRQHGVHFLDFRSYLLDQGIKDANITLTALDKQELANGQIPSSLLNADKLTGNAKFNDLLANKLIDKMIELKYIKPEQIK